MDIATGNGVADPEQHEFALCVQAQALRLALQYCFLVQHAVVLGPASELVVDFGNRNCAVLNDDVVDDPLNVRTSVFIRESRLELVAMALDAFQAGIGSDRNPLTIKVLKVDRKIEIA